MNLNASHSAGRFFICLEAAALLYRLPKDMLKVNFIMFTGAR
jgi:hypothetical protein